VRMSVVPSLARLWLMSKMPVLQGMPADVRIDLQLEHRVVDLNAGEADIAIRYGSGRSKGVATQLLFNERLYPVAAPSVARALGARAKPQRIAQLPLLHDSDIHQWRAWLSANDMRYRAKQEDRRFEDYDLVLAAAEAGLGVALLRTPLADSYVNTDKLVCISRPSIPNLHGHYLAMRTGQDSSAVLQTAERLRTCAFELVRTAVTW
jgi:LysR family transcriptional regulator, glycine cleavage system transcriptional activator